MNLKDTYDKIAEDWHKDHQADDWWVEGTDKFVSYLNEGDLVLDAGCGSGVKSKYLISKGLHVVGIDFSEKLVEIARREVPEGKFVVMDMKDARELKDEFDAVFAQASLLHVPKNKIRGVLEILASRLKKGGHFYIAVKEGWPNQPDEEIKEENDYGYPYQRFFSYFTMAELRKYFRDLGIAIVHEHTTLSGRTTWLQIIGQK